MPSISRFSVLIFPRKKSKLPKLSLYCRISYDTHRCEFSLKQTISSELWDSTKGKMKGNSFISKSVNQKLDEVRVELYNIYNKLRQANSALTAQLIKSHYFKGDKPNRTLLQLFDRYAEDAYPKLAHGTIKHFKKLNKYIALFITSDLQEEDVALQDLSYSFVIKFENFLKSSRCKSRSPLSHNSVIKHIQRLKTVIHFGIKLEWLSRDPFKAFKLSYDKVDRGYLNDAELTSLMAKQIDVPRLKFIRDIFVFSCYTGLAYIDAIALKPNEIVTNINGGKSIISHRGKNQEPFIVPLLSEALAIIQVYKDDLRSLQRGTIFPNISNQKLNAYLKELADICSIDKNLTFHLARHTFATTVTLSNGVPIESVSKMLGHTNIKTTQIYARVIQKKLSLDMKELEVRLMHKKSQNKKDNQAS